MIMNHRRADRLPVLGRNERMARREEARRVRNANARAADATRRANAANAQAKARLVQSLDLIKNLARNGGHHEYIDLIGAVRNFSALSHNSPNLQRRANAIFTAYAAMPGPARSLGTRTKLRLLGHIRALTGQYSTRHSNAIKNASLRYGLGSRLGSIARFVVR